MNQKEVRSVGVSRAERKKKETKQKIIDVAMKLFVDQGVDATTMEQIAEEVDIAKGTLYNYFPVKEAIISEFIQRSFSEKNPGRIRQLRTLPDTRSRLVLILEELTAGVQSQKEIFEKFLVYRMQNAISLQKTESERSGIEALAGEIIALGRENGEIRADLPLGLLEDLFDFIFIEAVKQLYLEPARFGSREVIEQCVDVFLNGVRPRK